MRCLIVAAVLFFSVHALESASEEEIASEENFIAEHVSLPQFHEKMKVLDAQIKPLLANDELRQKMLAERLEEIKDRGFVPMKSADVARDYLDINEHSKLDGDFYEGDILLTQEQLDHVATYSQANTSRARRQAWKPKRFPSNIWGANTPIPYSISENYPKEKVYVLRQGMKFWEDNTCVRFREGAPGTDRVKFIYGGGCFSYIGKIGNEQPVSIGRGCEFPGTVTHELGHTIGLYHTQSRDDRDRYIIVNTKNLENGTEHNFDMAPAGETDNFGTPYEYGSNMHYHPYAFGKTDEEPTLVAVDKAYQYSMMGLMPTFYDVLLVNKYYGCFDAMCKGVSVQCQNGGVQDVNNCRQCRCPTGYGGPTCSTVDTKFKKLPATQSRKEESVEVGNSKGEMAANTSEEFYVVEAAPGKRLELVINSIENAVTTPDCLYGGMMIWTRKDTKLSGMKVCTKEQAEQYYLSDGEHIFIHVWNRYDKSVFKFAHRSS